MFALTKIKLNCNQMWYPYVWWVSYVFDNSMIKEQQMCFECAESNMQHHLIFNCGNLAIVL